MHLLARDLKCDVGVLPAVRQNVLSIRAQICDITIQRLCYSFLKLQFVEMEKLTEKLSFYISFYFDLIGTILKGTPKNILPKLTQDSSEKKNIHCKIATFMQTYFFIPPISYSEQNKAVYTSHQRVYSLYCFHIFFKAHHRKKSVFF